MSERLATNAQLWRLNQLGRLRLVDAAEPVTAADAKDVLAAALAHATAEQAGP